VEEQEAKKSFGPTHLVRVLQAFFGDPASRIESEERKDGLAHVPQGQPGEQSARKVGEKMTSIRFSPVDVGASQERVGQHGADDEDVGRRDGHGGRAVAENPPPLRLIGAHNLRRASLRLYLTTLFFCSGK